MRRFPVAPRTAFSNEKLEQRRGFPEVNHAELIRHFTLTPADEMFVRKFRGQGNVLGAAVQLCTLPWLGLVPARWLRRRRPQWPAWLSGSRRRRLGAQAGAPDSGRPLSGAPAGGVSSRS